MENFVTIRDNENLPNAFTICKYIFSITNHMCYYLFAIFVCSIPG